MNKIIAIVGMCGVGKSVACEYLEKIGFKKVYFGGVTLDILQTRNMEINPENEKLIREELRSKYGMSAYAVVLYDKIKELSINNNVVLDGLYSWDEIKYLQEKFNDKIIMIAIIADKNLRYNRLEKREIRPYKKEEAIKRDISEIENIAKAGPIAYANYYIDNNHSKEELYKRIDIIIKEIESRE